MTEDPKPPAHPPKRRSLLKLGVGLGTLAALGGGGWYAWRTWGARPAGEGFITATVQRASIEDLVTATGALQPRNYVDVGAQVSGQLRKLHVDVGSEVNEGDLLAEIDAETSAARVDASRAQLRSLQAQLGERELNLAKADRDLQRQKNLMAEDATTGETLQNAETTLRTVRAQIESTKAQIQQLQASMRVEEANLKYTRIYAPISGTVVSITSRQGQTLNANQQAPTLLRVADLSTMLVQSQVSEADVTRLRLGMDVYFTTLGGQGRRWYGRLLRIEPTPTVTNNVVLYNALFEVPNPNRSLMTQMTAQVFFVAAEARDVLLVPMSALTIQRGLGGGPGGRGDRAPADASAAGTGVREVSTQAGTDGAAAGKAAPAAAGAAAAGSAAGASGSGAPAALPAPAGRPDSAATSARPATAGAERRAGDGNAATANRGVGVPAAGGAAGAGDGAGARAGAAGSPGGDSPRPRFDREAWAKLSDAEKDEIRARRQAARAAEAGGAAGGGAAGAARSQMSDEERQRWRERRRAEREAGADAAAGPAATAPTRSPPAAQPVAMVVPAPPPPRRPRKAKVRVMKEDGAIEEREVTIGISNRVHAEVIEGLAEGERVIAGVRQPERARGAGGQAGATGPAGGGLGGPSPFGGPGGLPGPMAPGGAGRR